ncbi:MAG: tRNA (uracil-5-)-methyltransferase [Alcanivorax sp.]|jgi:tRNA (uracil-5-)-methyltransferase
MPLSNVKPAEYESLLEAKALETAALLAPFEPPPPVVIGSQVQAYRMRAEFRMWHEGDDLYYAMFRRDAPKVPVEITHFPVASDRIQLLMGKLLEQVRTNETLRTRIFQIEFLDTLAGDTLITLIYHRRLDDVWEVEASNLASELGVSIVGRSRKQKVVLSRDYVTECLSVHGREYTFRQFEQAFTQPNARVNQKMIEWARDAAKDLDGNLLELFCGNGNFTLPLAEKFDHVVATELSKVSTRAASHNLQANGIDNVSVVRLSAAEVVEAMAGKRKFRRLASLPRPLAEFDLRAVFVDPPRAGLDEDTVAMVAAFDAILYISCNPQTLALNLKILHSSHRIARFAMFDQFPYTHHMECGVLLLRR